MTKKQRIYSKNTDESPDECRRLQRNVDESQTNVDKCRRVQTSHQTNVDKCRRVTRQVQTSVSESLDECRKMQMSIDKSKIFTLIPEKVTHGPIFLLLQLCNSRPHLCQNLKFYTFICYYCSSQFARSSLAKPICLFLH